MRLSPIRELVAEGKDPFKRRRTLLMRQGPKATPRIVASSLDQSQVFGSSKRYKLMSEAMNSQNDFDMFTDPNIDDSSRLSILKNFKSINRVMRSSFMKNPQDLTEQEVPMFN